MKLKDKIIKWLGGHTPLEHSVWDTQMNALHKYAETLENEVQHLQTECDTLKHITDIKSPEIVAGRTEKSIIPITTVKKFMPETFNFDYARSDIARELGLFALDNNLIDFQSSNLEVRGTMYIREV